jgi:eukaryotic-like serine/threonine-protein kinase
MPLVAGTRLGAYEITGPLGAGGMGEVYRARDTRLDREVALKILPESFADDPDRLMRFEREAKTLAALNHPHIAQIHGLEERGAVRALVMELVEGEELSARIARGPIPLEDALPIARQIADALEAAHEAGIIHRDLKPANIKVRHDGTVKVLDFGLAKALESVASSAGVGQTSPLHDAVTITSPALTMQGVVLGTAAYMSPEQARGKAVDKRTDIWAFGCVLYEMLTGHQGFSGDTVTDVLAAIVQKEPDWAALPAGTPESLRRLLRCCLDKDAKQRLRDIGDARLDLEPGVLATGMVAHPPVSWGRRAMHAGIWLAAGAVLAAIVLSVVDARRPTPMPSVARMTVLPAADAPLSIEPETPDVAITPDGRRVLYQARRLDPDGARVAARQIVVRDLGAFEGTPLTNLGFSPRTPFTSPDGAWVGFETTTGARVAPVLAKAPVSGGPMVVICDLAQVGFLAGASWGDDGRIVFATAQRGQGLLSVAHTGGAPTALTTPDRSAGEHNHLWPEVLPAGRGVLFTIDRGDGHHDVAVLPQGERAWRVIVRGGSAPRYVSSGHVIYAAAGVLYGVGFDVRSLAVTSEPATLVDGVLTKPAGAANVAVAANGTLVYVPGRQRHVLSRLVWLNRDGTTTAVPLDARPYQSVRLSPDGGRIAVLLAERGAANLWVYDIGRDAFTRVTPREESVGSPVWSPDGERLAFWSATENGIFTIGADGTDRSTRLVASEAGTLYPNAWTPDGRRLAYIQEAPQVDLRMMTITPPHEVRPLSGGRGLQVEASFSADGRWVAHMAFDGVVPEIVVGPVDSPERRWPVARPGRYPAWSADGREVLFLEAGAIHRVPIDVRTGMPAGRPSKVVDLAPRLTSGRIEQTADALRFLMLERQDEEQEPEEIRVVLNWVSELRARFAGAGPAPAGSAR